MRFTVEALGFPPSDQRTLAATFSLSARREISFAQWQSTATEPPNLLVVDGDHPQALEALAERRRQGLDSIPVVIVAAKPPEFACHFLERPIRFLQLFKVFDQVLQKTGTSEQAATDATGGRSPAQTPAPRPAASLPVQPGVANDNAVTAQNGFKSMPAAQLSASPYTPPSAESPQIVGSDSQQFSHRQHSDWVLVVDDNLAVRRFMAQKLEQFNINIDFAASGEQAIGLSGTKHYTCVFLDVVMPGIDGYQVCKLIKGNRISKDVKVVMLTSRDSPFDKIRGKMAGCDAYLTKPVDEDKLMNTIVRFLPEGAMMGDVMEKNPTLSPQ